MSRNPFVKDMSGKLMGFARIGAHFVSPNYDRVLNGFFFELVPGGLYTWRFRHPLFDSFEDLNLLYSDRIGYLKRDSREATRERLVEQAYEMIKPNLEAASRFWSVSDFCRLYEEKPGLKKNAHAEMVLGFAQILLGERDVAILHLEHALDRLQGSDPGVCQQVLTLTRSQTSHAVSVVDAFENALRRKLGLSARRSP